MGQTDKFAASSLIVRQAASYIQVCGLFTNYISHRNLYAHDMRTTS